MWLSERKQKNRNGTQSSGWLMAGLAACMLLSVLAPLYTPTAMAQSSTLTATLRDDLPPALSILSPIGNSAVSSSSVVVEGTVHNVNQLMVYLDDAYYITMPLDAGAESFSLMVTVAAGSHTIKIVGNDPVTNIQIESSVTISYTPSLVTTTTEIVEDAVLQAGGVVVGAGNELKSQVNQASEWGPMKALTDASFGALKALDLVPVGTTESITKTTGRFTLVSAGLVLTVMPWSSYVALSRLRVVPVRAMAAPGMIGKMRILGIVLTIIPFVLMY